MNASAKDIREDIAFLKSLAEDGGAPTMGGGLLALAGACFGAASLAHWAAEAGYLPIRDWGFALLWCAALTVFLVGVQIARRRDPSSAAPSSRAIASVWMGVGWAICAIVMSLVAASIATGEWLLMSLISPVVLALYGAAWMVGAQFSKRGWVRFMPYVCFAAAIIVGAFTGRSEQYLVYAAALVLTAMLPGLALMRKG